MELSTAVLVSYGLSYHSLGTFPLCTRVACTYRNADIVYFNRFTVEIIYCCSIV